MNINNADFRINIEGRFGRRLNQRLNLIRLTNDRQMVCILVADAIFGSGLT